MAKRLLITGSRHWSDEFAVEAVLRLMHMREPDAVLVSGSCPTGADAIAERLWESYGGTVERHPADWDKHDKAAGPRRNQEMVDLGADVCVAFPLPGSRGTAHCMRAAEKAGITVRNYGSPV